MKIKEQLDKYGVHNLVELKEFIVNKKDEVSSWFIYQAAEFLNPNRESTAAFYTDSSICNYIMKELPTFESKQHIIILEPSVGAGNFIPFIAEKYKEKKILELYLIDIDENELKLAGLIFETYYRKKYPNIILNYINNDYLKFSIFEKKIDLVIGNPPYGKVQDKDLLKIYKNTSLITKSKNMFVFFLEKAIKESSFVSMIVPKSILNAPEYVEMREILKNKQILSILDFGEKGFKGVKIETINLFISDGCINKTHVVSVTQKIDLEQEQKYITDSHFPSWLLYRNKKFDDFVSKINLGVFNAFRDRQIVKSMTSSKGQYRILKSRNIGSKKIIDISGYDVYMDDISSLTVSSFLNRNNVIMIPNLSYLPRACFLPKNTLTDGSVALLTLKNNSYEITEKDLEIFATLEFKEYYRIARNYGTRSLNIDSNSVFYFGLRRTDND